VSKGSHTRSGAKGSGFSSGAFFACAFVFSGCSSTVSSLGPTAPDQNGVKHNQYRIECIDADECKRVAARTCGPNYWVLSEWHNAIPESNLPGLNEQSRPKDGRDWNRHYLPRQTGIESSDPMPLTSIVVACKG
jgi:hypothetical protein